MHYIPGVINPSDSLTKCCSGLDSMLGGDGDDRMVGVRCVLNDGVFAKKLFLFLYERTDP